MLVQGFPRSRALNRLNDMKCPRCGNELTTVSVGAVQVDACDDGCGGIWFDAFELEKMDQPDEAANGLLDRMRIDIESLPDLKKAITCPRCGDHELIRQQYPENRDIMIDKCEVCGGTWLDFGELFQIRSSNLTTDEARAKTTDLFREVERA